MRKLFTFILLLAVLHFPLRSVRAQETVFVPRCLGTNDTTAFSTIITAVGANDATIRLPYKVGTRCAVNTLTIPANVTIDNTDGTGIKVNTGQTLTVLGPISSPAGKGLFYNIASGQGTVSFAGGGKPRTYDVAWFGVLGAAHGSSPSNESDNFSALLTAVYGGGGGTIVFSNRGYRFDSRWEIPNDGAATPKQPAIRITGAGASPRNTTTPAGGTIIDMRYSTSLAKIVTRGRGALTIDNITFKDDGGDALPFLLTTGTTLWVHHSAWWGDPSKTGTSCDQDVIILGGTRGDRTGTEDDAAFQGYGTVIENNFFNKIRRFVYGRTFANGNVIRDNTVWIASGSNLAGGAAIEFLGNLDAPIEQIPNAVNGNVITGNLIEMSGYPYAVKLQYAGGNTIAYNNYFDSSATTLAYVRFESDAVYNLVIEGYHADTKPGVSDVALSNTIITSHQSQISQFRQPVNLWSVTRFKGGTGPYIEDTPGNTFQHSFSGTAALDLYYTPSGGAQEGFAKWSRASATDKRLQLLGTDNRLEAPNGTLRLNSLAGSSLILGDTSAFKFSITSGAMAVSSGGSQTFQSGSSLTTNSGATLTVGGGAAITKVLSGTASLNYATAGANSCEALTISMGGPVDGNVVQLGVPNALAAHNTTATFFGWVSAADTVSVRRCVITADGSDPAAATVRAAVTQF